MTPHPLLPFFFLLAACSASPEANRQCPTTTPHSVAIPGGPLPGNKVQLGSTRFHAEEAPIRTATVQPFSMDAYEVTNAQFAAFVAATGYITTAERPETNAAPNAAPNSGGAVFYQPDGPVDLNDLSQWWRLDRTANWRHPHGGSSTANPAHPVVQVTLSDAQAYATWAGRALPTEAEWEHAARAGVAGADYIWGNDPKQATAHANHWQGIFPLADTAEDGFHGLAPTGCFKPNPWGLYDMAGNVWELTTTPFDSATTVIKGGSWLCANNFCLRYRPAARQGADPTLPSDHTGFRTIRR